VLKRCRRPGGARHAESNRATLAARRQMPSNRAAGHTLVAAGGLLQPRRNQADAGRGQAHGRLSAR
jgi:hypothetical protein